MKNEPTKSHLLNRIAELTELADAQAIDKKINEVLNRIKGEA